MESMTRVIVHPLSMHLASRGTSLTAMDHQLVRHSFERSTLSNSSFISKVVMFITRLFDLIKSQSTVKPSRLLHILTALLHQNTALMAYLASRFLSKCIDQHSIPQ